MSRDHEVVICQVQAHDFGVFNVFKLNVPHFWAFYQHPPPPRPLGRNSSLHLQDLSPSSLISPLLDAFYDNLMNHKIKEVLLVTRNDALNLDPSKAQHFWTIVSVKFQFCSLVLQISSYVAFWHF